MTHKINPERSCNLTSIILQPEKVLLKHEKSKEESDCFQLIATARKASVLQSWCRSGSCFLLGMKWFLHTFAAENLAYMKKIVQVSMESIGRYSYVLPFPACLG